MSQGELGRDQILEILRSTADSIGILGVGLSESLLSTKPAQDEWSMGEIVGHLVLEEQNVLLPRFTRLVKEGGPVFDSSVGLVEYPHPMSFTTELDTFRKLRAETLAVLGTLGDAEWQRPGTTPTRGPITIESYARYAAHHDLEHLQQLQATLVVVRPL